MNLLRYRPMLAEKMDKAVVVDWMDWIAEKKYDGNRLVVFVGPNGGVIGYNRPRKKSAVTMEVCEELAKAPHLVEALSHLPYGVYDGELLAGDTATDVKRLDLAKTRTITLFDVLELDGQSTMGMTQDTRRLKLTHAYSVMCQSRLVGGLSRKSHVTLSEQFVITSQADVVKLAQSVWKEGGEGLILKHRRGMYQSNKRSTNWIKIKREEHFTLEVTGFEATRGTVMKRGPFAVALLKDAEGNTASCKTRDDFELERLEKEWTKAFPTIPVKDVTPELAKKHPRVGTNLVIECGGRTRGGGYKGPVLWDRWENE